MGQHIKNEYIIKSNFERNTQNKLCVYAWRKPDIRRRPENIK